jgi:hypothetical protein
MTSPQSRSKITIAGARRPHCRHGWRNVWGGRALAEGVAQTVGDHFRGIAAVGQGLRNSNRLNVDGLRQHISEHVVDNECDENE